MCSWCQIFWILNFRHFFTSKFVLHLCFVCKSKDSVSKSILKWEECELLCGPLDIYDCFSLLIILLCIEASSVNLDMRQKYLRTLFNLSLTPKPPQQTFRYIRIYILHQILPAYSSLCGLKLCVCCMNKLFLFSCWGFIWRVSMHVVSEMRGHVMCSALSRLH